MQIKIGVYCRISLDWEGEGLGVARQREDCRKLADLRGWDIAEFYTDNNVSAFKSTIQRPEFERMLTDLSAGKIDGIVAYDLDRIARQPVDLERIIKAYEQRPGLVFATVQGSIDLSSSDGLTLARVMVTFANKASMDTSRRTKRKNLERAQLGLSHGGHRPFGYEADFVTINEGEAAVLKDIAERLLSGHSFKEIAWHLNEAGITTAEGKQWVPITVRNMMQRQRYVGLRTHLGVTYPAAWPAIFTPETWEQLQLVMRTRRERFSERPKARKYLLTGFLYCGKCGNPLNGETKRDKPERPLRRTYQCRLHGDTTRKKGCGGVTRNADALDAFIRDCIVYRLDSPELAALLTPAEGAVEVRQLLTERQQKAARLNALVDDFTDGTLTKAAYTRAVARVETALAAIDRQLEQVQRSQLNVSLNAGESVEQAWRAQTDGWRRELIGMLISKIMVLPGNTKPLVMVDGKLMRFDKNLIEISWRA